MSLAVKFLFVNWRRHRGTFSPITLCIIVLGSVLLVYVMYCSFSPRMEKRVEIEPIITRAITIAIAITITITPGVVVIVVAPVVVVSSSAAQPHREVR